MTAKLVVLLTKSEVTHGMIDINPYITLHAFVQEYLREMKLFRLKLHIETYNRYIKDRSVLGTTW